MLMSSVISTKYLETLQYILSSEANNDKLGKVKLMKLLYFADFDHYAIHGRSITGDTYYKLPYGPVPRYADVALLELQRAELLTIKQRRIVNFFKYEYELTPYSFTREKASLLPEEVKTLDAVISKWKDHSTQDIVAASHGEIGWQMVDFGEPIPYEFAYARKQICTEDEEVGTIRESRVAS